MDPLPKTKVDVTKITGPYGLLGLFLLITEGLLGFWFFRAGDKMERMVVGGLMTLIFMLFLYVVMRIATKVEQAGSAQPVPRRRWPTVLATVAVLAFIGLLSEEFDTGVDTMSDPFFPGTSMPTAPNPSPLQGSSFVSQPGIEDLGQEERSEREAMLEERIRQLEEQMQSAPASESSQPATVDLSGFWRGADGIPYVLQQHGNSLLFQEQNHLGVVTAAGEGTISGREVSITFETLLQTTGSGTLSLDPSGTRLTGTLHHSTGISGPISLTLVQRGASGF